MTKTDAFLVLGISAIIAGGLAFTADANSPEKNTAYLQAKGYSSVAIGDYNFWCGKGTPLRRHFKAVDPQGQNVEGDLCGGRIKFFNIDSDTIKTHVVESKPNKLKM